eukprot:185802-Pleurochrysis_carterae.AAC.3
MHVWLRRAWPKGVGLTIDSDRARPWNAGSVTFCLSVYSELRVYLCDRKNAHRRTARNIFTHSDCHYRLYLSLPILPTPISS